MTEKILMVDDEPLVLAGYRRFMNAYFDVHTVSSSLEGLKMLSEQGPYAAVIVDYLMPEMDGVEFTVRAREVAPRTPRIMLTGRGDLRVATEALNRGNISYFLAKPCPREELLEALITAVERYRHPDVEPYVPDPTLLAVLKNFFRGRILTGRGNRSDAAECYRAAMRLLRQEGRGGRILALTQLHLANLLASSALVEEEEPSGRITELISGALQYFKEEESLPLYLLQDRPYVEAALQWAMEGQLEGPYLAGLAPALGFPGAFHERLRVLSLGSLRLWLDDEPLDEKTWRNPKLKMLFLYLLTRRRVKTERDLILDTFWPEMEPRQAANNFSTCLYLLRQTFFPELFVYRKGLCWLGDSYLNCDADFFEKKVEKGLGALAAERHDEALMQLEQARSVYRGHYLEEYLFEDWAAAERTRLQGVLSTALVALARLKAGQGCFAEAAEVMTEVPLEDAYDDEALFLLVSYHLKAGNRGKAQRHYNHYRAYLAEALGIEPAAKIGQLLEEG